MRSSLSLGLIISLGLGACSLNSLDGLDGNENNTGGGGSGGKTGTGGVGVGGSGGGVSAECKVAAKAGELPYAGAITMPGSVEAENYDRGGEGVGYHDLTAGNEGKVYRDDGVDIKANGSGYAIGWFQSGEWLAYTIDVKKAGKYHFDFRVGSADSGRTFKVEACGKDLGGDIAVPQTSDWGQFSSAGFDAELASGVQVLRVIMGAQDYMDFDGFSVTPVEGSDGGSGGSAGTTGSGGTGGIVGNPTFSQVIAGIRPRGQQCGSYKTLSPQGGSEYFVATNGNDQNAGTSAAPFRNIQRAADAAKAGDVITIRSGNYDESVSVKNGGTASAPLVFQAESCGSVTLGGSNDKTFDTPNGAEYVVIRGLGFHDYANQAEAGDDCHVSDYAVKLHKGWRIEDCSFDHAGSGAIRANGDGAVVTRTTIVNSGGYSIEGAGDGGALMDGLSFSDLIIHDSNAGGLLGPACGASLKLLYSKNVVVDNVESYSNVGPGWWFDWENYDLTIKNSYFHDNKGRDHDWEGLGVALEGPGTGGEVAFNVFHANSGSGLGLYENHDREVHDNLFADDEVEFRGMDDHSTDGHGRTPTTNIHFKNNQFRHGGYGAGLCGWTGSAADNGITADFDVFDVSGTPIFNWCGQQAMSLSDVVSMFGFEKNGQASAIAWPPSP